MQKHISIFVLLLFTCFLLHSQETNGVYLINEGNFGWTPYTSSLDFYDIDEESYSESLFQSANNASELGDVFQSLYFCNGKAYMLFNASNHDEEMMIVADSATFESLDTLKKSELYPRYFAVWNDTGILVSRQRASDGIFAASGRLYLIDLETNEIADSITGLPGNVNEILVYNDYAYVLNEYDAELAIVNLQTHDVDSLECPDGQRGIVLDENNKIWVACGGSYTNSSGSKLIQIDPETNSIIKEIESSYSVRHLACTRQGDTIFTILNATKIMKLAITASSFPDTAFATVSTSSNSLYAPYGFGFDPYEKVLYYADAQGFTGSSKVWRYDAFSGEELSSLTAGVGTNGFVFTGSDIPPVWKESIPDITMQVSHDTTIDVSEYVYDEDNDITSFSYKIVRTSNDIISATFDDDELTIRSNTTAGISDLVICATSNRYSIFDTISVTVEKSTGIEEIANDLKIYQSGKNIIIESTSEIQEVLITNASGQLICRNKKANRQFIVPLHSFSRGIYAVSCSCDDSIISKRIFVE